MKISYRLMKKFNKLQKPGKVLTVLANLKFSLSGFLLNSLLSKKSLPILLPFSLLFSLLNKVMNPFSVILTKNKSCKTHMFYSFSSATWGARTPDLMIKSHLLYQLS